MSYNDYQFDINVAARYLDDQSVPEERRYMFAYTIRILNQGKVPARLIDQRFGRGAVLQEAINSVLPQAYGAAVQEHDLRPLGQPDIDISELNDGTNVVFTAEVDVRPDFELPELSGLSIEVPVALNADLHEAERVALEAAREAIKDEAIAAKVIGEPEMLTSTDAPARAARADGGTGTHMSSHTSTWKVKPRTSLARNSRSGPKGTDSGVVS